ncbi:Uncharacterised protein [uncultured archaeon]|nr:Uncharacterised protein [uncultured archaeon]
MNKLTSGLLALLLLISVIPAFIPVVTAAPSTWFVAITGNDTTGDGRIGKPFATLRKAVDMSSNGDTICLRVGNYNNVIADNSNGFQINRSGTKTNPYTIMAYNHEKVILNGNGKNLNLYRAFLEIRPPYHNITLRDLTIENITRDAVAVNGDETGPIKDINIINCKFNNVTYSGVQVFTYDAITLGWIENVTVRDCNFYKIQMGESMGESNVFTGVRNFYIYNNTFRYCNKIVLGVGEGVKNGQIYNNSLQLNRSSSGEGIYIDSATYNGQTASHINIFNNVIFGYLTDTVSAGGINICGEFNGGKIDNISIYNNIINLSCDNVVDPSNIYLAGIELKLQSESSTSTYKDVTIKHNTIFIGQGNGKPIAIHPYRTTLARIIIANNILVTNETRLTTYQILSSHMSWTEREGIVFLYNNTYNYTHGVTNLGRWEGDTHLAETTAIIASPEFMDYTSYNFLLKETSPCIDAANEIYTIFYDIRGVPRPQGAGYDIGAYEILSSGDSTLPVISQVGVIISNPLDTQTGYGWENFTCGITDNVGVLSAVLKFTNPDQSTTNIPMTKRTSTTTYYVNRSLNIHGNYSYRIQATDSSNNIALSSTFMFSLAPNWDVNLDGNCLIYDLILISNHYGGTGASGWIREDVDNDGQITVLDLVYISDHYGTSWWT